MTNDRHMNEQNQEVEFEREDLGAKPIFTFLIVLALGCLLVYFLLRGAYRYMNAYEERHQPAQSPLAPPAPADTRAVGPGDIAKFAQPRLETDERQEINDFRLREDQRLSSYGWIDQASGVVHIPIERAMELVAQRGLPTRMQTAETPPRKALAQKPAVKR